MSVIPSAAWSQQAVAGNGVSGVTVATTITSMSEAVTPASSIARSAATLARLSVDSPAPARRRCRMPVRGTIHSSDVSR